MASPSRDILIVGAGVLGLSTAAVLRGRGHAVTVVDPGGPNASSVAAGMIAPAMESAIEGLTPEQANLLRVAAALWPVFADSTGIALFPALAEWRGEGAGEIQARLLALGFACERTGQGVRTSEDFRLSPVAALARLGEGLSRIDGRIARVVSVEGGGWMAELPDGSVLKADAMVLATGAEVVEGLPEAARAALAAVRPVRGQIGFVAEPLTDRTLRGPGGYVTPVDGGVVIGATMETGRRDLEPDEATGDRLLKAAEALLGQRIDASRIDWRVGIRGASPDGRPLAGLVAPGLAVALAPRRNGWLLGPLVGEVVADAIEGRAPRPEAAAFDPLRFSRAG